MPISAAFDMKLLLSVNGLAVALLGIFPQPLMSVCEVAFLSLL
jgi:NADH-quinone oxidoreductase subunit N